MTQINAYLHLNGTAREAMEFYKDCLGGELTMQTVGESPMQDQMPPGSKDRIMHASLSKGNLILLMASDMMDPSSFTGGDTVSLSLNCSSDDEIKMYFAKLSRGGKVTRPLKEEFWGATFGMITDKFGIDWMLNYDKPKT